MKKFTDEQREDLILRIKNLRKGKDRSTYKEIAEILGYPEKTIYNLVYKQREREKKSAMKAKPDPLSTEQITKIVAGDFDKMGALEPEKPEKIKRTVKKVYIVEPESMQYIALEIIDQGNEHDNKQATLDKVKYCEFKEFADVTPGLNNQ